jgi:hypothetical protein
MQTIPCAVLSVNDLIEWYIAAQQIYKNTCKNESVQAEVCKKTTTTTTTTTLFLQAPSPSPFFC